MEQVVVMGLEDVDTSLAGRSFSISYSAWDLEGNQAGPIVRTVTVLSPCPEPGFLCAETRVCTVCSRDADGLEACECLTTIGESVAEAVEVETELQEYVPPVDTVPPTITLLGDGQLASTPCVVRRSCADRQASCDWVCLGLYVPMPLFCFCFVDTNIQIECWNFKSHTATLATDHSGICQSSPTCFLMQGSACIDFFHLIHQLFEISYSFNSENA